MTAPRTILPGNIQGHIVLFALAAWGHVRPLCVLASKIVKYQPTYITFFTTNAFKPRVEKEISRNFEGDDALCELIRVIALSSSGPEPLLNPSSVWESFATSFDYLADGKPITCPSDGRIYEPVPPPNAVIMDFFCHGPIRHVREKCGEKIKALLWYSGAATSYLPYFKDKAGLLSEIHSEALKTGKDVREVAAEAMFGSKGIVIKVPGFPPMYDHECNPQMNFIPATEIAFAFLNVFETLSLYDGIIISTPKVLERTAVAAIADVYAETSRVCFAVGPLLPEARKDISNETLGSSTTTNEIEQFADRVLKTHGPKSMLYISFGTVFWSSKPEIIWTFLEAVMEKKIPFIMSHASPFAQVPESIKEKVRESGLGILSPWSPQQALLAHPATGWFVTHTGHNSVVEAITARVPMICWPFSADQPYNTINLTMVHDVAYELIEVRTGEDGLKVIHRLGRAPKGTLEATREETLSVLDDAFGSGGARKRKNMERLQGELAECWEEGGSSQVALEGLIASLGGKPVVETK